MQVIGSGGTPAPQEPGQGADHPRKIKNTVGLKLAVRHLLGVTVVLTLRAQIKNPEHCAQSIATSTGSIVEHPPQVQT